MSPALLLSLAICVDAVVPFILQPELLTSQLVASRRTSIAGCTGDVEQLTSSLHTDALALHSSLELRAQTDSRLGVALKQALRVLSDALRLYGPEALVTSFNGGKDAVVVLHLMRATLAQHNERSRTVARLSAIFFEVPDEFPQVW